MPQRESILQQATETAQAIGDSRGLSFALGQLGNLYETQADYQQALSTSQKAQLAAAGSLSEDSLYQWQWQEGRIQSALGNIEAAKAAYRKAIATLQQIRSGLAQAAGSVQFDFQTQVEPVYRELLALLLKGGSQPQLKEALSVSRSSARNSTSQDVIVRQRRHPKKRSDGGSLRWREISWGKIRAR